MGIGHDLLEEPQGLSGKGEGGGEPVIDGPFADVASAGKPVAVAAMLFEPKFDSEFVLLVRDHFDAS